MATSNVRGREVALSCEMQLETLPHDGEGKGSKLHSRDRIMDMWIVTLWCELSHRFHGQFWPPPTDFQSRASQIQTNSYKCKQKFNVTRKNILGAVQSGTFCPFAFERNQKMETEIYSVMKLDQAE